MKKIILALTTFLLAVSLTACSSAKPEDTIDSFLTVRRSLILKA